MNNKGFTIVEVLIVLVIMGILLALTINMFGTVDSKDNSWCNRFRYSSVDEIPNKCLDYLVTQEENK